MSATQAAEHYLHDQPWAAKAKYQISTDDAYIYFADHDPVDEENVIRFKPFALIWKQNGNNQAETPITIVSDSAHIQFASRFSITDPNPGRVIAGAFQGKVRIRGPDGLEIVGRNFAFEEKAMRIWCDERVWFKYGPHHGNAFRMQIELIPDEEARKQDKLAVAGIESVRLRRDVTMELVSESPNKPGERQDVTIKSAGSFNYVLETHVATFEEKVRVRAVRADQPKLEDALDCDRLTLVFEPAVEKHDEFSLAADGDNSSETADRRPDSSDRQKQDGPKKQRFGNLNSQLAFRRLRAEGRIVLLNSESNELTARMGDLVYDAQTRVVKLTDRRQVRVFQGASEMRSPEIRLVHDEAGTINTVWCRGAGWLKSYENKTGKLELASEWSKQLRKYPDPDGSGLDIVELEGQAILRQPVEKMGLAAEFVKFWIDPQPAKNRSRRTGAGPSGDRRIGSMGQYRPQRVLAVNDVALISPGIQATAKQRLEVWFENRTPSAVSQKSSMGRPTRSDAKYRARRTSYQPRRRNRRLGRLASGSRHGVSGRRHLFLSSRRVGQVFASTEDPFLDASRANGDKSPDRTVKPRKRLAVHSAERIKVRADLIQLRVVQDPAGEREPEIAEVRTEGNVDVRQEHAMGEKPLHVTGSRLHILNRSETDQLLKVYGTPAHVRDRGVHIEGREINLDRGSNYAWVTGAGTLELPVKNSLEGEELEKPELLDVRWKEQMTFDGETAHFFGDVRSKLEDSRMFCQEMEVRLTKRISFTNEFTGEQERNDAKIRQIFCKGGVEFESDVYEAGKRMEIRRGRFAEFSLNQTTGDTNAQGRGWISTWRRSEGNRAGLVQVATMEANQPSKPKTTDWEYTRIDFAGRTKGNIKQRLTVFEDRVSIVYGPVQRLWDTLDPDKPKEFPKDGGWMRCETLELTEHEETATSPEHREVVARGNAELDGRDFRARADQITYDESKGLYILRSIGNHNVTIWRQTSPGGDYSRANAQRMEFIPSRNQLKFFRTTGLQGLQ